MRPAIHALMHDGCVLSESYCGVWLDVSLLVSRHVAFLGLPRVDDFIPLLTCWLLFHCLDEDQYVTGHLAPEVLTANYKPIEKSRWKGYLGPCYEPK